VELFVSALGSKSEEAKRQSLTALSKAGKAATAALPKLRQLAADPNESELLKKSAKDAIRKIEP